MFSVRVGTPTGSTSRQRYAPVLIGVLHCLSGTDSDMRRIEQQLLDDKTDILSYIFGMVVYK